MTIKHNDVHAYYGKRIPEPTEEVTVEVLGGVLRLETTVTVDHWPDGTDTFERIVLDFTIENARRLLDRLSELIAELD